VELAKLVRGHPPGKITIVKVLPVSIGSTCLIESELTGGKMATCHQSPVDLDSVIVEDINMILGIYSYAIHAKSDFLNNHLVELGLLLPDVICLLEMKMMCICYRIWSDSSHY
jgi:hypothetical protein